MQLLLGKPMLGTLGMQQGPIMSHFFDHLCCYLSNFLPLLSPSPWRVHSSKVMLLGTLQWPWVTPPWCVLGQMVRWPLYYRVWKYQAITTPWVMTCLDVLLSSAPVAGAIVSPSSPFQLPISHRQSPAPVTFLSSQARNFSHALSPPSAITDKQESF